MLGFDLHSSAGIFALSLIALSAFLIGASKGGLPVVGMVSVPILAMVMSPVKATALLLPIYIASDMASLVLYRKSFSWPHLRLLLPAACVGVLIGWGGAAHWSDTAVSLLIGSLGIAFCLRHWLGAWRQGRVAADVRASPSIENHSDAKPQVSKPSTWFWGAFWGTTSGFTSFIAHAGGPPYQIYMLPKKLPKLIYAGTTTWLFTGVNLAKLPPYMQLQPYSWHDLVATAYLLPIAWLGTLFGAWFTKRVPDRWFFAVVRWALFLVSVQLVLKVLAA